MPGSEYGGSGTGLSARAGRCDPDAAADVSRLLYLSGVWNGISPHTQPLSTQAGRPAVGGSAGCDPA